jgi:hypothetical protein
MAKRKAIAPVSLGDDILDRLHDLHKQATIERSHHYAGRCIRTPSTRSPGSASCWH